MRSFAIEEPGSPVPALYATLEWTGGKLTSGSEGVVDEGEPSALCVDAWGVVGPG